MWDFSSIWAFTNYVYYMPKLNTYQKLCVFILHILIYFSPYSYISVSFDESTSIMLSPHILFKLLERRSLLPWVWELYLFCSPLHSLEPCLPKASATCFDSLISLQAAILSQFVSKYKVSKSSTKWPPCNYIFSYIKIRSDKYLLDNILVIHYINTKHDLNISCQAPCWVERMKKINKTKSIPWGSSQILEKTSYYENLIYRDIQEMDRGCYRIMAKNAPNSLQ